MHGRDTKNLVLSVIRAVCACVVVAAIRGAAFLLQLTGLQIYRRTVYDDDGLKLLLLSVHGRWHLTCSVEMRYVLRFRTGLVIPSISAYICELIISIRLRMVKCTDFG